MMLVQDLLDRYLEKVPDAQRDNMVQAIKDSSPAQQIEFVKKWLAINKASTPKPAAKPAGQIPQGNNVVEEKWDGKPAWMKDPKYKDAF